MNKIRILIRKPVKHKKCLALALVEIDESGTMHIVNKGEVVIQELVTEHVFSNSDDGLLSPDDFGGWKKIYEKGHNPCLTSVNSNMVIEDITTKWTDVPIVFEEPTDLEKHQEAHEAISNIKKSLFARFIDYFKQK